MFHESEESCSNSTKSFDSEHGPLRNSKVSGRCEELFTTGSSLHPPDTQIPISHCLLQGPAAASKGINDHDDTFCAELVHQKAAP